MDPSVTLLGVKGGPSIRPGSNMPTALLVRMGGKVILVDAGLGASRAVCTQGVALNDLDMILITHLHSDHYMDLGPLLHTAWTSGLNKPIPVIGPSGLTAYWQHFLAAMDFDISLRIEDEGRPDLAPLAELGLMTEGTIYDHDGLVIDAILNEHPPIKETFALRFRAGGRTFVFSGDTAPIPKMVDFARGADLLVHEAMLLDGIDVLCRRLQNGDERLRHHLLRSHTAAEEVGRIAREAGVKRLALTHFVPDGLPEFTDQHWRDAVRSEWDGAFDLGKDGMVIAL